MTASLLNGKTAAMAAIGYISFKGADHYWRIEHDLLMAWRLFPLLVKERHLSKVGEDIITAWDRAVRKYGDNTFIIFEDRRMTFRDADELSNLLCWYLHDHLCLVPGESCIALVMENKPDFVCWWLAAAKAGVKVALVNHHLKSQALAYAIRSSSADVIVFDPESAGEMTSVEKALREDNYDIRFVQWEGLSSSVSKATCLTYDILNELYPNLGQVRPEKTAEYRKTRVTLMSTFGYIYTSGTMGMPKAAKISHARMSSFGLGMAGQASYIGEVCRYLTAAASKAPNDPLYRSHKLRIAIGNGLRPEVWGPFQDTFGIPQILEFYGSTEGNGALVNLCESVASVNQGELPKEDVSGTRKEDRGAVGVMGVIARRLAGFKLAKFDVETETLVRNKRGFCIEADLDEPGELLMPIRQNHPATSFAGYTDTKATEDKIVRGAFVAGDSYFRSGDLLRIDNGGRYYFVDRVGDTFRWKGENVSTLEVSNVVSQYPGIAEANVYGVKIPGEPDGRGCMVALRVGEVSASNDESSPACLHPFDEKAWVSFKKFLDQHLPKFSIPLFVRLLTSDEDHTSTFKQIKSRFVKEGCDPDACAPDNIIWLNPHTNKCVVG
ncbi:hypothetical protein FOL47_003134 [Perkinsus chesapeaki]|uniref:AMP-dependent synthetase/ligase domain-containing protein n=1 Tax=Perkinsus chesapeaki TaxID=330153 RepID=A0A7J6MB33_PERCH|nr:hypothetical protein FOL47_003134 [Perkinsus chesapeaki]